MKRITSIEIRELKLILKEKQELINALQQENQLLRLELAESRSKEGKGALEKMVEGISIMLNSIDWNHFAETLTPIDQKLEIEEGDEES